MASPMEFWGVVVKGKEPCGVSLDQGSLIHVSQVTLGDIKKDKETVIVHVKVGDKKLVMAMLSQATPQLSLDLVFDKEFEISHNWKNGSVHIMGYQAETGVEEFDSDNSDSSSDEEEDDVPIAKENGQIAAPAVKAPVEKPKVENKPKPEEKDDSDEDDSSEEDAESDDEVDADEMRMSDSDDDEDSDEEDSEDEKPAEVANAGKKRPNADAKTPQSKKAKITTPQKTDEKKGKGVVHIATPHPSKKGGKTPAGDKTPKSDGSDVSCGSCKKTFKSESALKSHSQAKHGAK